MATKDTNHDAASDRTRSPIEGVTVLFIYIAIYLALWGILRVLISLDAAAAIPPDDSMAPSAAAPASPAPTGVGESLLSESPGQASEQPLHARECRPSAGIDSQCIFN